MDASVLMPARQCAADCLLDTVALTHRLLEQLQRRGQAQPGHRRCAGRKGRAGALSGGVWQASGVGRPHRRPRPRDRVARLGQAAALYSRASREISTKPSGKGLPPPNASINSITASSGRSARRSSSAGSGRARTAKAGRAIRWWSRWNAVVCRQRGFWKTCRRAWRRCSRRAPRRDRRMWCERA